MDMDGLLRLFQLIFTCILQNVSVWIWEQKNNNSYVLLLLLHKLYNKNEYR